MHNHDVNWTDDGGDRGECQVASAGKIQMLGLDAIKSRLGAKWDRMSDLVHRYFESAIKREMRPGDTFCHSGELSYLVLFREVTVSEAQLKCTAVVEDVCRKLFGEESEDISVRHLVAPTDALDLSNMHHRLRLSDLLEHKGREARYSVRGGATLPKTEKLLRVKMGSATGTTHSFPRESPAFVYRPLWDTSRNVVLTYLCQLLPDTLLASTPFSWPAVAVDGDDDQATLDILCMTECLRRARRLREAGLRVLLAAPFHFATLSRMRQWSRYKAILDGAALELFRDIAFLVHGFEPGVPHIRLSQELPKLSRYSKHLFCLLEDPEGAGTRFRNTGVQAVGFGLLPGMSERAWIDRLRSVARDARDNALDTLVLGASTRSAAVNAIGAGARYVDGTAVRAAVADPKNAFIHEVEDLYRHRVMPA